MSEADHKIDHKLSAKSDDPITHLHDYDVDLQSNHIYLMASEVYHDEEQSEPGIEYIIANRFIRNLNLCMRVNPNTPIVIHMKTTGGHYQEGMAIYDAIKSCPYPVTILCYTQASSMSSVIFQAANKRVMMPHSHFMFHDGETTVTGTMKQVYSEVEFSKIQDEAVMDIYVNAMKTKGKYARRSKAFVKEFIRKEMDKKEDVFLTAKQAVELGFADYVFDYNWKKLTEYTDDEINRG